MTELDAMLSTYLCRKDNRHAVFAVQRQGEVFLLYQMETSHTIERPSQRPLRCGIDEICERFDPVDVSATGQLIYR